MSYPTKIETVLFRSYDQAAKFIVNLQKEFTPINFEPIEDQGGFRVNYRRLLPHEIKKPKKTY